MKPKLYVASRASIAARPMMWRTLRALGWNIISSWIDEAGPGESNMTELWGRIVQEIKGADALIVYIEDRDLPLKGALVEVGIALGSGIPVALVCEQNVLKFLGSWIMSPSIKYYSQLMDAYRGVEQIIRESEQPTPEEGSESTRPKLKAGYPTVKIHRLEKWDDNCPSCNGVLISTGTQILTPLPWDVLECPHCRLQFLRATQ